MNLTAMRSLAICAMSIVVSSSASIAADSVRFAGADGFELHGAFYQADRYGPGVLLLHQCDREGEETGYEALAQQLQDLGMSALVLDLRGYGKSAGDEWGPSTCRQSRRR